MRGSGQSLLIPTLLQNGTYNRPIPKRVYLRTPSITSSSSIKSLPNPSSNQQQHIKMAPHIRSISRSTGVIVGLAGTASAAPLLFFVPGFEERLAAQAAKWGPRWNRGFASIQPHAQRVWDQGRVEPAAKQLVRRVEPPLKKTAQ